jgi:ADP-heptose:LPS heptosyltransferase
LGCLGRKAAFHVQRPRCDVKPKLLVVELWGLGDLAIATPFLRRATERFDVTLLAKPYARDLQERFWPPLKIIPFNAPWTAFHGKYRLLSRPWRSMFALGKSLRREHFDIALSARWDPRDHFLLRMSGAPRRLGFPRTGSRFFLTQPLLPPGPLAHRYENWRVAGRALDLDLEPRGEIHLPPRQGGRIIFVHTGAAQPVRVWPLARYRSLVKRLRDQGHFVRVVCNPEQRDWWRNAGEPQVETPPTIAALMETIACAGLFIGNDSGPGHLAAISGIPTFTLFGPQVPEWFVPLHPASMFMEGKPCPYKPCSDYCRFPTPRCLDNLTEEEVWPKLDQFIAKNLPAETA